MAVNPTVLPNQADFSDAGRRIQDVRIVSSSGNGTGGNTYTLASNDAIAADESTTPVTGIQGGSYIWNVVGTFGGATLTLQSLGADGVTWLDVAGASLTEPGNVQIVLGQGASVRITSTGGTGSAGIYSNLT